MGAVLAAYAMWVNFSYLVIPVGKPASDIKINIWRRDGYYKIRPGTYEYEKYGITFTINTKGFRGPEFETQKGRAFRIITLGESSTIGIESDEAETWPRRLQQHLSDRGVPVEVINAGINGATSKHHRALLRNEILAYHPDLIIYYAGFNDHSVLNVERYPGPERWPKGRNNFFRVWRRFKAIQARLLLLQATGLDMEKMGLVANAWTPKYRANLEAMVRESANAGIEFVMVPQILNYPLEMFDMILQGADMASISRRLSLRQDSWYLFLRQVDLLNIQKSVALRHADVKFVDLHGVFRDAKATGQVLFYDPVHLTPKGNALLAQSLAAPLHRYYCDLAGRKKSSCDPPLR